MGPVHLNLFERSGGIVYDPNRRYLFGREFQIEGWKSSLWKDGRWSGNASPFPLSLGLYYYKGFKIQDQLPNGKTCALSLLTIGEEEHLKIDKKLTALVELVMPMYNKIKLECIYDNPINLRCTPQVCQH